MNGDKLNKTNLGTLLLLVGGLVVVGTLGYMIIEGWSALDAVYMVVITLATVGYREVHTLSPAGTIFTMLLIVFGIVTLYYVVRVLGEYFLANQFDEDVKNRRMQSKISSLTNHCIVCGFGRVGSDVVDDLIKEGAEFVVIESRPDLVEECRTSSLLCVAGDATTEETLLAAGAMNAKSLIVALGRDSDNILTVITARSLNGNLFIVSRANTDAAVDKLLRVGANRAVSPYQISAFRMTTFALRPNASDFIDNVVDLDKSEVQITDVTVASNSPLVGSPLDKYLANRKSGMAVLVLHRSDGESLINPAGETEINAGDRLIIMGTRANLTDIDKLINR